MGRLVLPAVVGLMLVIAWACGGDDDISQPTQIITATALTTPSSSPRATESQFPSQTPTPLSPDPPQDDSYWYFDNFDAELLQIDPAFRDGIEAMCSTNLLASSASLVSFASSIWEYGKAAAIYNVANDWFNASCAVKANPGVFLPLPPASMAQSELSGAYPSEECEILAVQASALYIDIAQDTSRNNVYFTVLPALEPLVQDWYSQCDG